MLFHLLRILIGLFFIVTGLIKLYPIEPFEIVLVNNGICDFILSPLVARLIIGFEVLIGVLICLNYKFKSLTIPLSFATLTIFTLYLFYLLMNEGNNADCGCLGDYINLSPTESILKNLALLSGLFIVLKNQNDKLIYEGWMTFILFSAAIVSPFLLNPLKYYPTSVDSESQFEPYVVDFMSDIPKIALVETKDSVDITVDKKLIAVLSTTCEHCIVCASKLKVAQSKVKLPPIYILFKGAKSQEAKAELPKEREEFFRQSKSYFPNAFYHDNNIFKLCSGRFPTLLLMSNDTVLKKWHGQDLTNQTYQDLENIISNIN